MAADMLDERPARGGARGPRKRQAVLDAARRVFTEKGYNASMEEVAFEAEVSKQTIYNQFGSKEQLFHAMAEERVQEIIQPLADAAPDADPREVLSQVGRIYHTRIITPDSIKLVRAMIAAPNAASVLRDMYAHGPAKFTEAFTGWLTDMHGRGRLNVPDPRLAAEHFTSFTFGTLYLRRLWGVDTPLDLEDAERRVKYCVEAFLRAHAVP